jgi:hypothetical protein
MSTIEFYDCPNCGTKGVLPMSDGKCPNCKAVLIEEQKVTEQSIAETEKLHEKKRDDNSQPEEDIQPPITEAMSAEISESLFSYCPGCGAGGIIPDKDGRCTNCGYNLENEEKGEHTLHRSYKHKKKLFISIVCIIATFILLIYGVFFYAPEGKRTIFEQRDFNRYKKIIIKKEYEKLQAYVIADNRYEGIRTKLRVEELGVSTLDVCRVLHERGVFDEEWIAKSLEQKNNRLEKLKFALDARELAIRYIEDEMSSHMRAKYALWRLSIGVKRRWYHYLLL